MRGQRLAAWLHADDGWGVVEQTADVAARHVLARQERWLAGSRRAEQRAYLL